MPTAQLEDCDLSTALREMLPEFAAGRFEAGMARCHGRGRVDRTISRP
jgi:hypothetical protein